MEVSRRRPVVDLDRCTGCQACVVACHAENNIPVAGEAQAAYGRWMHWIIIQRYWEGEYPNVKSRFMPVMCQQCGEAPCEPVCPGDAPAQQVSVPTAPEVACDPTYLAQSNPFARMMRWRSKLGGRSTSNPAPRDGSDGSGSIDGAPDFGTPEAQAKLREQAGSELCILAFGRGSMPGWRETLTVKQMWQALTYLGSLQD